MANYSAKTASHATLAASTPDAVTLSAVASHITVVNRTGAAEIYFTLAPGVGAPVPPVVAGANTLVVPAAITSTRVPVSAGTVTVTLISSGAEAYSVEAL